MKNHPERSCMAHRESETQRAAAAALRVLIAPSIDGGFVAQGIDIDFTATGDTEELAREHFARAFSETITAYLRLGRDLAGLFKTAVPAEFRKAYFAQPAGAVFVCAVSVPVDGIAKDAHYPSTLSFLRAEHPLAA